MKVRLELLNIPPFGVDTLEDLENARKQYSSI